jgi:hypothetical protein
MRIEFTYILDDLQEALVPERHAADPQAYRRTTWVSLIGWIVAMFVFGLIWFAERHVLVAGALSRAADPRTPNPPQSLTLEIFTTTLPASVVTLILGFSLWHTWSRSRWRKPGKSSSAQRSARTARTARIFVLTVAVLIGLAVTLLPAWTFIAWHPSQGELIAIRSFPWLVSFGILLAFGVAQRHWLPRRQWFDNPGFARPRVVDLDDDGVRFADSVAVYEFKWPMFVRARETPNLLLLVSENKLQWIIPKRAFSSQAELENARALIQNMIPNTTFQTKPIGFPLSPLG